MAFDQFIIFAAAILIKHCILTTYRCFFRSTCINYSAYRLSLTL